jgi:hypothetical protein
MKTEDPYITPRNSFDEGNRLKVVIAYEDIPAGRRAMSMLDRMAQAPLELEELFPSLWQFDLLEDPDWRELATKDALKAAMIIISASSASDLPTTVREWIKVSLDQKQGATTAVVALLGPTGHLDDPASPRIQYLKETTDQAGQEFFAPGLH